jgi:hypothetical protein
MAAVLYFGFDDKLPQILEAFFLIRKEDSGETNSLTRAADLKKFDEVLGSIPFDVVYVEQTALDKGPVDWITSLKKRLTTFDTPIILTGLERDPAKIMKMIEAGYADYHVNPPDKPLVLEKFRVYATGKRDPDLRQVFTLKMSQPSDIARPGFLEDLSEFDCHVRSAKEIPVNDLVILYAEAFSPTEGINGSILCRCSANVPHDGFKGQFLVSLFFVGPTPEVLTHIRNALRKSYVASKNKG